jgi:hypothetical protein
MGFLKKVFGTTQDFDKSEVKLKNIYNRLYIFLDIYNPLSPTPNFFPQKALVGIVSNTSKINK